MSNWFKECNEILLSKSRVDHSVIVSPIFSLAFSFTFSLHSFSLLHSFSPLHSFSLSYILSIFYRLITTTTWAMANIQMETLKLHKIEGTLNRWPNTKNKTDKALSRCNKLDKLDFECASHFIATLLPFQIGSYRIQLPEELQSQKNYLKQGSSSWTECKLSSRESLDKTFSKKFLHTANWVKRVCWTWENLRIRKLNSNSIWSKMVEKNKNRRLTSHN